ncbi:MAG TPA: hypothetical protein VLG11_04585 [Candidatus Saccharimonadales bacterium]|nr:hypothetical protein [Candidatus Saccharimonadales bacterium]
MSDIESFAPLAEPARYYERYCGEQRPEPTVLNNVLDYVVYGDFKTAALFLTAGEACIDLAFADPGRSAVWIKEADTFFDDIISETPPPGAAPDRTKKIAHLATEAALRKAELRNWEAASNGRPTASHYRNLLEAAESVAWLGPLHHMADSKLIEFMPILLGARWLARGEPTGWHGRLSLVREGGQCPTPTGNPNWDAGIVFDESAAAFDNPPFHLELKKRGSRTSYGQYAACGTLVVKAERCGLDNVSEIILGCAQESGQPLTAIAGHEFFKHVQPHTTKQLDEITAGLRKRIDAGIQAGLGDPSLRNRQRK